MIYNIVLYIDSARRCCRQPRISG